MLIVISYIVRYFILKLNKNSPKSLIVTITTKKYDNQMTMTEIMTLLFTDTLDNARNCTI